MHSSSRWNQLQGVQKRLGPIKAAYLAQVRQQLASNLTHFLLVADVARQARQQLGRHAQILQVETQALQVQRLLPLSCMLPCTHSKVTSRVMIRSTVGHDGAFWPCLGAQAWTTMPL